MRVAVARLVAEGMAVVLPNDGLAAYDARGELADIYRLCQVEGYAGRLAAARSEPHEMDRLDELVVKPGKALTSGLLAFDRTVVDGLFSGGAVAVGGVGSLVRRAQNGFVRSYALSIMGGVLLVVLALLAVNLA